MDIGLLLLCGKLPLSKQELTIFVNLHVIYFVQMFASGLRQKIFAVITSFQKQNI